MARNRSGPICTCEKCGRQFRSWHRNKLNRWCSRECAPTPGRRPKKPQIPCDYCGVLFIRYGGGPRIEHFCSRKCYREAGAARRTNKEGYVRIYVGPDVPGANKSNGQMLESRYVMQQHLGRPLNRHETVHHINGIRHDNRIENLQLRSGKHGKGVNHVCLDCGSHNIGSDEL